MKPNPTDPAALTQGALSQTSLEAGMNGSPSDGRRKEEDTEELNYEPVPPQQTVTVTVHYRVRGRGQPLPYPLDEGDGG